MKRYFSHVVFLAFTAGCIVSAPLHLSAFQGESSKASGSTDHFCTGAIEPPLEIELEVSNIRDFDGESGTADFLLSITPLTESVRVSWEVTAPAQLSPIAGKSDGIEPVRMGEKLSRSISFSITDGGRHYIYARAILETTSGDFHTRAVSRYVDLGAPDVKHPSFVRTDAVRGDVTSFKGVMLEGGDR